MALAATDARFSHGTIAAGAGGCDFYPRGENAKRTFELGFKNEMLAAVVAQDIRDRAGFAVVWAPGQPCIFEKAALLAIATTIVVAVEVAAFFASRGAHIRRE